MSEYCQIKPGGQLIHHCQRQEGKRAGYDWVAEDHTEIAFRHLFTECRLHKDVTLRDIFQLLNRHLDLFDTIFGNWCRETVTKGLSPLNDQEPSNFYYLEIAWCLKAWYVYGDEFRDVTEKRMVIEGHHFPSLYGLGPNPVNPEDDEPSIQGVDFLAPNQIAHLPVRLKDEFVISDMEAEYEQMRNRDWDFSKCKTVYEVSSFNLGHILQGILWEISFHGDPDSTEQMSKWLDGLSNDSE